MVDSQLIKKCNLGEVNFQKFGILSWKLENAHCAVFVVSITCIHNDNCFTSGTNSVSNSQIFEVKNARSVRQMRKGNIMIFFFLLEILDI